MSIHIETIQSILRDNNGYITAMQVTSAGIPRRCLSEMLLSGDIYKIGRGIYALPEVWEDEMYFLQHRYGKGIFSHGTALYLHGFTDRTPSIYTMTFPYGYNPSNAKKQGIVATVTALKLYEMGIIETASPCGNPIKVYDVERTLCDIVRGQNIHDVQLVNPAMKMYTRSKNKNLPKLLDYAKKLRVESKILGYIQILL